MNILFLCPSSYSYDIIINELKRHNNVYWYEDGIKSNLFFKLLSRINKKILTNFFNIKWQKMCKHISSKNINKVILIFGALYITEKNIILLKKSCPKAEFIYYAWDSFKNFPKPLNFISLFDRKYSFDKSDCDKYNIKFLPLFYSMKRQILTPQYDVSLIMTISKKKIEDLNFVESLLPKEVKRNFIIYIGSFLNIFKVLKKIEFKIKLKNLIIRRLSSKKCNSVFLNSKVTIDIPLKGQNGLTQRTFDALYLERKIITTNKNIIKYDFYCPDNIFVVDKNTSYIPSEFFKVPFNLNYKISEKYSLETWINNILFDVNQTYNVGNSDLLAHSN